MKKVITTAILLVNLVSFAQIKSVSVLKQTIGDLTVVHKKNIKVETNETTYFAYVEFQNNEYRNIEDRKTILFFNQSDLETFIVALKKVQTQMLTKEQVGMNWHKREYDFSLRENDINNLYVIADHGRTTINLQNLTKLIELLSTIQIGKES